MKFYGYLGSASLGEEPCGTEGRHLKELKTIRGAIKHFKNWFNNKSFKLYSYVNFYDDETFKLIYIHDPVFICGSCAKIIISQNYGTQEIPLCKLCGNNY